MVENEQNECVGCVMSDICETSSGVLGKCNLFHTSENSKFVVIGTDGHIIGNRFFDTYMEADSFKDSTENTVIELKCSFENNC